MSADRSSDPGSVTELTSDLYERLLVCDRAGADGVMTRALKVMSPLACAEEIYGPTLNRIGQAWSDGTLALAQLYLSSRICEDQMERLLPESGGIRENQPRLGIAVLADYHALGKRIVHSLLRAAGYSIFDYGLGLSPKSLADKVRADNLDAILVSTLMLPSALQVASLSERLQDHPVKVFVGGAPFLFDPELWKDVGAHAMGQNAASALALVESLQKEPS